MEGVGDADSTSMEPRRHANQSSNELCVSSVGQDNTHKAREVLESLNVAFPFND